MLRVALLIVVGRVLPVAATALVALLVVLGAIMEEVAAVVAVAIAASLAL